jgi:CheY-like chemotaxis protein
MRDSHFFMASRRELFWFFLIYRSIYRNGIPIAMTIYTSRSGEFMETALAAAMPRIPPMNLLVFAREPHIRKSCSSAAANGGMSVTAVATAQEAMAIMNASSVDVLIADLKLCESEGLNIKERVQVKHPEMAIIGLTGRGKIDLGVIVPLLNMLQIAREAFLKRVAVPIESVGRCVKYQPNLVP